MRRLVEIVGQRSEPPLLLPPQASVKEAWSEMRKRHADSVLITDQAGTLIGIFTASDAINRVLAIGRSAAKARLADVMTNHPVALTPDKTAIDALRVMWDCGLDHLPVTNCGKVIGCLSQSDFQGDERECHAHERELWEHMR